MNDIQLRTVKSFVLRQGRSTKGQQLAMEQFWPVFGLEKDSTPLNFSSLFGNDHPVTLEIGFGNGDSLAQMAEADRERNFIGVEVHTPGVGHLMYLLGEKKLSNVRAMNSDAVEILHQRIPSGSLDRIQLYFPDPWQKKRHHKRRIVQTEFVELLASRLKIGGILHLATDWQDYARHMSQVMQASSIFKTMAPDGSAFSPRPDFRPLTKFEQRGLRLGHGVWDLLYHRL